MAHRTLRIAAAGALAALAALSGGCLGRASVMDVLSADPQFAGFAELLRQAELEAELRGPGPYTVFAPTDAALGPAGSPQREALAADKEKLRTVLRYHLTGGRRTAAEVADAPELPTLAEGKSLRITAVKAPDPKDSQLMVDTATVVRPDVQAGNGVIHGIDQVLGPR